MFKIRKITALILLLAITGTMVPCSAANLVPFNTGKPVVPPSAPITNPIAESKPSADGFSMQSIESKVNDIVSPQKNKPKLQATYSGTCGNRVTWNFQPSTGKLTVSGSGEMLSYANFAYTPWSSLKSSITSVEIKEGITNVGANAFHNCDNLKSVTISNSVINIEMCAFCDNSKLVSVTFGKNIHNIKAYSFSSCTKLKYISLPDSLVSLGEGAFYYCSSLLSVSLGNGLTTIENSVFSACDSLTSIVIPSSVLYVGNWAFFGCSNLAKVVVLGGSNHLGEAAFMNCQKLSSFTYLGYFNLNTGWTRYQFDNTRLNSIVVPNNYKDSSFYGKSVTKSPTLFSWRGGDNIGCILDTNSNTLTVSGSGQMYEYNQFPWDSYRSTIKTLVIEEGVTSISEGAFKGFSELTSIIIPKSINSIGSSAFEGCNNLHSVTYLSTSDPGKTSNNVFTSSYLSFISVTDEYSDNRFCGLPASKPAIIPTTSPEKPITSPTTSPEKPTTSPTTSSKDSNLSVGKIIGIVVGAISALTATAGVTIKCSHNNYCNNNDVDVHC